MDIPQFYGYFNINELFKLYIVLYVKLVIISSKIFMKLTKNFKKKFLSQ